MPRRRDRHERGLRGPLVLPSRDPRRPGAGPRPNPSAAEFFTECLGASLARIEQLSPGLLQGVDVGLEEVPALRPDEERVPLAAAIESTAERPARVVVFRRPLEHRSTSRRHLRRLVHRTVVEQLAALTARSPEDIDPMVTDED